MLHCCLLLCCVSLKVMIKYFYILDISIAGNHVNSQICCDDLLKKLIYSDPNLFLAFNPSGMHVSSVTVLVGHMATGFNVQLERNIGSASCHLVGSFIVYAQGINICPGPVLDTQVHGLLQDKTLITVL